MTDQTPEPEVDQTEPEQTEDSRPNREAAKYRRQLREAEAERDHITGVVDTYRRREAEAMLEQAGLTRGADVFDLGTQLNDLLADDGTVVDPEKVATVAAEVLAERPHWAKPRRPQGDVGQGPQTGLGSGVSWSDVLNPGRR